MGDQRWSASDGWVKMQRIIVHDDGSKTVIHFVYNSFLDLYDDFKIVDYGGGK